MAEEPKITAVEKVKNPGRVAAGKRLAAISKAAERKKAEEECIENSNLLYVTVGVLGVTGLGYGVYNLFREKEEQQQEQQGEVEQQQEKVKKK